MKRTDDYELRHWLENQGRQMDLNEKIRIYLEQSHLSQSTLERHVLLMLSAKKLDPDCIEEGQRIQIILNFIKTWPKWDGRVTSIHDVFHDLCSWLQCKALYCIPEFQDGILDTLNQHEGWDREYIKMRIRRGQHLADRWYMKKPGTYFYVISQLETKEDEILKLPIRVDWTTNFGEVIEKERQRRDTERMEIAYAKTQTLEEAKMLKDYYVSKMKPTEQDCMFDIAVTAVDESRLAKGILRGRDLR